MPDHTPAALDASHLVGLEGRDGFLRRCLRSGFWYGKTAQTHVGPLAVVVVPDILVQDPPEALVVEEPESPDQFMFGWTRDRSGRWSQTLYNSLKQVVATRDAENRVTNYAWCRCGALKGLTDSNGNRTSWNLNIKGQITEKIYPDGSKIVFEFDADSGEPWKVTDPKGRIAILERNLDGSMRRVRLYASSANLAAGQVALSTSWEYNSDPNYLLGALSAMVGPEGRTELSYFPITNDDPETPELEYTPNAGRLMAVNLPGANDFTFDYDDYLGTSTWTLAGKSETSMSDRYGRIRTLNNPLGTWNWQYIGGTSSIPGASGRVSSILGGPNGNFPTLFAYHGVLNDFLPSRVTGDSTPPPPLMVAR